MEFVMRAQTAENFRALCREYGISPKVGYKWSRRFVQHGLEGLKEESRKPRSSPAALGEEVVCRIVLFRKRHPHWGAKKIHELYQRSHGEAPSQSSIKRVLEKCGLVKKRRVRAAALAAPLLIFLATTRPSHTGVLCHTLSATRCVLLLPWAIGHFPLQFAVP